MFDCIKLEDDIVNSVDGFHSENILDEKCFCEVMEFILQILALNKLQKWLLIYEINFLLDYCCQRLALSLCNILRLQKAIEM